MMRCLVRAFLLVSLCLLSAVLSGCSTPQGGSSIPWARPEPWETQPSLMPGVKF